MEEYSIDYGKLAYLKTEDLSKRILAVEDKKQLAYNSLLFKSPSFSAAHGNTKTDFFNAGTATDLSLTYKISASGAVGLTVYLNDIFMYAESFNLSGEKTVHFEARGVAPGEKALKTVIDGDAGEVQITLSGHNLAYMDYNANLSYAVTDAGEAVFAAIDGYLTLYEYKGGQFVKKRDNFPKAKYCKVLPTGGKTALLYTAEGGCLWFELCDPAGGYAATQKCPVLSGAEGFTAWYFLGGLRILAVKNGRVYMCEGEERQGRYYFTAERLISMPTSAELQCISAGDRFYLAAADKEGSARLYLSQKNTAAADGVFKFKTQLTVRL